ncbi:serine/threonine protein kinase [Bdellovibrionota bacterium]
MKLKKSFIKKISIPIVAIVIGCLIHPLLKPHSLVLMHKSKAEFNPTETSKDLFIIKIKPPEASGPSFSDFDPIFSLFGWTQKSTLFSLVDWNHYPEATPISTKLPPIGFVLLHAEENSSPLSTEVKMEIPRRYKLSTFSTYIPDPAMKYVGILSIPDTRPTQLGLPLLFYNEERGTIAFSATLLAYLNYLEENLNRIKLEHGGLFLPRSGVRIPLNSRGEMLINDRLNLNEEFATETFKSFYQFVVGKRAPREYRSRLVKKINVLLPDIPPPQLRKTISGDHVSPNEFRLRTLNTLLTQDFLQELNWFGWGIFSILLVLLVLINLNPLWLFIFGLLYALCTIALYTFSGLVFPFLSAEVSVIMMIFSALFKLPFPKKKAPKFLDAPPLDADRNWGRFQIISTLNKSKQSIVARTQDPKNRKTAILKILLQKGGVFSLQRMVNKNKRFLKIDSPYLIRYFEIGKSNGYTYLLAEDNGAHTLKDEISEGLIGVERALSLFTHVLKGLEACHDNKNTHGNLKPSNILIQRDGSARLSDFEWTTMGRGIREVEQGKIDPINYLAPEVIEGGQPSTRSDLYAAGIILFEMLTGRLPFKENAKEKIIEEKLHAPTPHIRDQMYEIPGWLDDFIQRLIARKPADRLYSATQAIELFKIGLGH